MSMRWFALQSKPTKECFLSKQLELHKVPSYYPCLYVHSNNKRTCKIEAYFPRYVFGYIDFEKTNISEIRWMPGLTDIVSFGGLPASISDGIIAIIRTQVDRINTNQREQFNMLKRGDAINIQNGPFVGYEAIFDRNLPGTDRVRIFLKLLQNQHLSVELPASMVC